MFAPIKEINALRLTPDWALLRFSGYGAWRALWRRGFAFFWSVARSFMLAPGELLSLAKATPIPLALFSSTENQTKALLPIANQLQDSGWIFVNQKDRDTPEAIRFPFFLVSIVSILSLPISLVYLAGYIFGPNEANESRARRMKTVAYSFDELLRSYGYLTAAMLLIWRHGIKTLIMSNDHNSINRALCHAGKNLGITTIYLQHAPVNSLFPKLNFSLALLDGEISAELYRIKPSSTKIELIGAVRYDQKFSSSFYSRRTKEKIISLCLNKLDKREKFLGYLRSFEDRGWKVIVRPHPGMSAAELSFLPGDVLIDQRDIATHLARVHFLLAGSSGVLLDAFMAGVIPLMATDLSKAADYYGFLRAKAVYPVSLDNLDHLDLNYQKFTLEELKIGMTRFNAAISCQDPYDVASVCCRRVEEEVVRHTVVNDVISRD